ncbi:DUF1269 domain-containing protein [Methylomonas sp. AM2-LC]|uniref:DUF1269 domain-containing protein n=1 Tax=Methylomonas sp. AM2-LC TaxID=3153301 RepID=UPI0032667199
MKRIYFLAPDINITQNIVNDLLSADIEERHIHVIGKPGSHLEALPEATFLQKSDFIPALEQGLLLGAATGLFCGLVALILPMGLVLGGGAVLAISTVGAGLGSFSATLVGISADSRRLKQFDDAIKNGEFLVMIDMEEDQIEKIKTIIVMHHPEVDFEGVEPHFFA